MAPHLPKELAREFEPVDEFGEAAQCASLIAPYAVQIAALRSVARGAKPSARQLI
jgi:hypothetical protein